MAIIIVSQDKSGSSSGNEGHNHNNLALLNQFTSDSSGNLLFHGSVVGEKAIEIIYEKTLTAQDVLKGYLELPEDCNTNRAITLILESVPQRINEDWEVIAKTEPEKDRIAWRGLDMENIVKAEDKVSITYYKKNN